MPRKTTAKAENTDTTTTAPKTRKRDAPVAIEPVRLTPAMRRRMIAEAAYFKAQQRGLNNGNPIQDWLAAEQEIDAHLLGQQSRDAN